MRFDLRQIDRVVIYKKGLAGVEWNDSLVDFAMRRTLPKDLVFGVAGIILVFQFMFFKARLERWATSLDDYSGLWRLVYTVFCSDVVDYLSGITCAILIALLNVAVVDVLQKIHSKTLDIDSTAQETALSPTSLAGTCLSGNLPSPNSGSSSPSPEPLWPSEASRTDAGRSVSDRERILSQIVGDVTLHATALFLGIVSFSGLSLFALSALDVDLFVTIMILIFAEAKHDGWLGFIFGYGGIREEERRRAELLRKLEQQRRAPNTADVVIPTLKLSELSEKLVRSARGNVWARICCVLFLIGVKIFVWHLISQLSLLPLEELQRYSWLYTPASLVIYGVLIVFFLLFISFRQYPKPSKSEVPQFQLNISELRRRRAWVRLLAPLFVGFISAFVQIVLGRMMQVQLLTNLAIEDGVIAIPKTLIFAGMALVFFYLVSQLLRVRCHHFSSPNVANIYLSLPMSLLVSSSFRLAVLIF